MRYGGLRSTDSDGTINSLRILILTSEAPPVVSGIAKTVALLERGLTGQGHVVDIVSRDDFPKFIRSEFRFSAFVFFWSSFRRRIRHYDVVNVHGPVPTLSEVFLVLARCLPRTHRPAIVYTHHSDIAIPRLERWCGVYNRLAGKVAHNADRIVVSSTDYQDKMVPAGTKPVDVIRWAVDSVHSGRPREPRQPGHLKVLFVGQLREYKGVEVLLEAVRSATNTQVSIVGDGPLRAEIGNRLATAGYEHVTMHGRLTDAELHHAYNTHDVIVLPSTTTAEAYGLVLAEGMTAGCVPIASDLPGVREVASATGVLIRPGDSHTLRQAFESLRTDHLDLELRSVSSLIRSREFSVERMAKHYERAFKSAIASTQEQQRPLVVPPAWAGPERMFDELADLLGADAELSLSVLRGRRGHLSADVWTRAPHAVRSKAPVAWYVAAHHNPLLISEETTIAPDLRPLLVRQDLKSSIIVPIRKTRGGTSVLGISTKEHAPVHLNGGHLELVLKALARAS